MIEVVEFEDATYEIIIEKVHPGGFEGLFLEGPRQGERVFIPRERMSDLLIAHPEFGKGWSLAVGLKG